MASRNIYHLLRFAIITNICTFLLVSPDTNSGGLAIALPDNVEVVNGNSFVIHHKNASVWTSLLIATPFEKNIDFQLLPDTDCDSYNKYLVISYNYMDDTLIKINWSEKLSSGRIDYQKGPNNNASAISHKGMPANVSVGEDGRMKIFFGKMDNDSSKGINAFPVMNRQVLIGDTNWFLIAFNSRLSTASEFGAVRFKRDSDSSCLDFQIKFNSTYRLVYREDKTTITPTSSTITPTSSSKLTSGGSNFSTQTPTNLLPVTLVNSSSYTTNYNTTKKNSTSTSENTTFNNTSTVMAQKKSKSNMTLTIILVSAGVGSLLLLIVLLFILYYCGFCCFARHKSTKGKNKTTTMMTGSKDEEHIWEEKTMAQSVMSPTPN